MSENKNQSGWYQSEKGTEFHTYGQDMSDETIKALGKMADAVERMSKAVCPDCGARWRHGLECKNRQWVCACGWTGEL